MRVVCPRAGLQGPPPDPRAVLTIQQPDLGLVYAVASHRGYVYAVNGPTLSNIPVKGKKPKAEFKINCPSKDGTTFTHIRAPIDNWTH